MASRGLAVGVLITSGGKRTGEQVKGVEKDGLVAGEKGLVSKVKGWGEG
ncbi:hypothetical protein KAE70_03835 [Bartonella henselae]|nr:hypothetical protein [Bartonella henselae]UJM33598.1 hypothetical protein KAE70_03835 [Bartonella henselae]